MTETKPSRIAWKSESSLPVQVISPPPIQKIFRPQGSFMGWIEFEYEGHGVVRLEEGSCVHQPPGIRHREVGHSDDVEMLEVVMPGVFKTVEVASVEGPEA